MQSKVVLLLNQAPRHEYVREYRFTVFLLGNKKVPVFIPFYKNLPVILDNR
jgi:putative effector of murein hydrolase